MTRGVKPQIKTHGDALVKTPNAPSWLTKDGKAEWRRVAPILVERRVLTEADLGTLESYCTAVARIREAERLIAADGPTYVSSTGIKRHPAVSIQDASVKSARLCASELGLTPVSRGRAGGAPDDDDDLSPLAL